MNESKRGAAKVASTRVPLPYVLLGLAAVSFPTWWSALMAWTHHGDASATLQNRQIREIVRDVKTELAAADSERIARGEAPLFLLGTFDLDLKFTVANSSKVHGESSPAFIVVGSEENIERERVQEVHLHFVAAPDSSMHVAARVGPGHSGPRVTQLGDLPPTEKRP